MELYKELFRKGDSLKAINFCISQFERSKLTLSEIQHKKVLSDIDMNFEELIGALLSAQEELVKTATFK